MAGWKLLEMVVLLFIVTKNGMINYVVSCTWIIKYLSLYSIDVILYQPTANGILYGFDQVDYTASEGGLLQVTVIKRQENIANFTLTITPFTQQQFSANSFPLPVELQNLTFDPAECEYIIMQHTLIIIRYFHGSHISEVWPSPPKVWLFWN